MTETFRQTDRQTKTNRFHERLKIVEIKDYKSIEKRGILSWADGFLHNHFEIFERTKEKDRWMVEEATVPRYSKGRAGILALRLSDLCFRFDEVEKELTMNSRPAAQKGKRTSLSLNWSVCSSVRPTVRIYHSVSQVYP